MPLVLCVVEGRAQSILLTGTAVAVDTNNNGDPGQFFAGVGWRIGTRTLVKVFTFSVGRVQQHYRRRAVFDVRW